MDDDEYTEVAELTGGVLVCLVAALRDADVDIVPAFIEHLNQGRDSALSRGRFHLSAVLNALSESLDQLYPESDSQSGPRH